MAIKNYVELTFKDLIADAESKGIEAVKDLLTYANTPTQVERSVRKEVTKTKKDGKPYTAYVADKSQAKIVEVKKPTKAMIKAYYVKKYMPEYAGEAKESPVDAQLAALKAKYNL